MSLQNLNYAMRLNEIDVPTLFMTGVSDHSAPPAIAKAMHELVSGSACTIIDPASHLSNMENPLQFNHALATHLDSASQR